MAENIIRVNSAFDVIRRCLVLAQDLGKNAPEGKMVMDLIHDLIFSDTIQIAEGPENYELPAEFISRIRAACEPGPDDDFNFELSKRLNTRLAYVRDCYDARTTKAN